MSKELKTGIISLIIIALGIWGYNFLKGENLFNPTSQYFKAEYKNISGLSEASVVTINGLQVGKINKIEFSKDPKKKGKLVVTFSLDNKFEFSKNSVAKIYSAGLMGGQNLAIVPNYEGEIAKSGDFLKGTVESDLFSSLGANFGSTQQKLDNVLISADSLLSGLNEVLDKKARKSLNRTAIGLETTVVKLKRTLNSVNSMLENSKVKIEATFDNTKKITDDFSKVSQDLAQANLGETVKKIETTLQNTNALLADMRAGKGTIGKLITDEQLYTNLTKVTKEMEELLREMKLNPKRFVHFSLFGKKPKPYNEKNNHSNISNSQIKD